MGRVLAIASGKGGVGKSLLAANLSIALSRRGQTVTLVDLDLGGSNLHLLLGLRSPQRGVGNFLKKDFRFENLLTPTQWPGLSFIAGDTELPELAHLRLGQKKSIIKNLRKIKSDWVILDLGAGTGLNTLDFFLAADEQIVVSTPTLSSTTNAYLLLKNALFRLLSQNLPKEEAILNYWKEIRKNSVNLRTLSFPKLIEDLYRLDSSLAPQLEALLQRFTPCLVFNRLHGLDDLRRSLHVQKSSWHYLGLHPQSLGHLLEDPYQDLSLKAGLPIIAYKPQGLLSSGIFRLTEKILQRSLGNQVQLSAEEQLKNTEQELQEDYTLKLQQTQQLLGTPDLTLARACQVLHQQQQEINLLRQQNSLLKKQEREIPQDPLQKHSSPL